MTISREYYERTWQFAHDMLKGFGIDPARVCSFTLNFKAGELPTIAVEKYADEISLAEHMTPQWHRWQLVPIDIEAGDQKPAD